MGQLSERTKLTCKINIIGNHIPITSFSFNSLSISSLSNCALAVSKSNSSSNLSGSPCLPPLPLGAPPLALPPLGPPLGAPLCPPKTST